MLKKVSFGAYLKHRQHRVDECVEVGVRSTFREVETARTERGHSRWNFNVESTRASSC